MLEYQISVEDLASTGRSVQREKQVGAEIPQSRNRQDLVRSGKRPQWIHDALADGQSLDKYPIWNPSLVGSTRPGVNPARSGTARPSLGHAAVDPSRSF